MTKGITILKALITKRTLEKICKNYDISYKFCYAVSEGIKTPSWDMINKFRFLIPVDFWFDDANNEFINKLKASMAS